MYYKYDQASDLWQQFKLSSELESWPMRNFQLGQEVAGWFKMVLFDQPNNTIAIDVKIDGSDGYRCWGWLSLLNWIVVLTLYLLLELPPRKLKPCFILWSFFLLRLLNVSMNLRNGHAWNIFIMSGLVLLVAPWSS